MDAYEKMAKKLMEKFMDAYTDGFCALLQKQVDAVVDELKGGEQRCHTTMTETNL